MDTLSWLQQLIARWQAKSPKGFKIITNIALVCGLITGIPMMATALGLEIPEVISPVLQKIIFYAALVGGIIAKLTVSTPAATEKVLEKVDAGIKPETAKEVVDAQVKNAVE